MIRIRNLNKTYFGGSPLHVLKGINMDVARGEFLSIMGASGSGKSTLLNILGILDSYDTGEYILDNTLIKNLSETKAAELRNQKIGFIFQSFNLITFKNAMENVALPLYYQGVSRKKRNILAMEYLDKMGLRTHADHMPNELSGGQRQRVAIARALIAQPQIILADEPTGALDSKTSVEVMRILRDVNINDGITMIIVTHEHAVAEATDRIIHFKDGVISQDEDVKSKRILNKDESISTIQITEEELSYQTDYQPQTDQTNTEDNQKIFADIIGNIDSEIISKESPVERKSNYIDKAENEKVGIPKVEEVFIPKETIQVESVENLPFANTDTDEVDVIVNKVEEKVEASKKTIEYKEVENTPLIEIRTNKQENKVEEEKTTLADMEEYKEVNRTQDLIESVEPVTIKTDDIEKISLEEKTEITIADRPERITRDKSGVIEKEKEDTKPESKDMNQKNNRRNDSNRRWQYI